MGLLVQKPLVSGDATVNFSNADTAQGVEDAQPGLVERFFNGPRLPSGVALLITLAVTALFWGIIIAAFIMIRRALHLL